MAVTTALLGCFALSAALSGYLFKHLQIIKRILLVIGGISLMVPVRMHEEGISLTLLANLLGGVVAILVIMLEWLSSKKEQGTADEHYHSSNTV